VKGSLGMRSSAEFGDSSLILVDLDLKVGLEHGGWRMGSPSLWIFAYYMSTIHIGIGYINYQSI